MSDYDSEWVSARSVAWVLDDAPVPAHLIPELVAIARRCDEQGEGSYQSMQTIAEKTGRSVEQTERNVKKLRELKLIELGDQSLVAHYPAGKRPVVYDLPLDLKGPKPAKASKNPTGGKKSTQPTEGTPRMDAGGTRGEILSGFTTVCGTPRMDAGGGMDAGSTPRMDAPEPPASMRDKQPLNNPVEQPSLSRGANPAALLAERGVPETERDDLIQKINEKCRPRSPAWWRTVAGNGDLDTIIQELRAEHATPPEPAPDPPCGQCDRNRQIELSDGSVARCPRCHPLRPRPPEEHP